MLRVPSTLVLVMFLGLGACAQLGRREPRLELRPVTWASLSGWAEDDAAQALQAFRRSCAKIADLPEETPMGGARNRAETLYFGTAADWRSACTAAGGAAADTADAARGLFESEFVPFAASNHGARKGLFTGYYEAEARGSIARQGPYQTPILKRPANLVSVDLGQFRERLRGLSIAGKVEDGRLVPYATRAEIESGALDPAAPTLVFLDDPVDAFFIHVQGSGRIKLDTGGEMRIGYDGQNGREYTSIGRVLLDEGALEKGKVSMQTIRAWLASNPDQLKRVLDANASYVFFKALPIDDPELGPPGAEEVVLTPGRSLAVDRRFHALGVPMWLETTLPSDDAGTPGAPYRRLMIAQDTGGAIRGPVRGDVFFGFGEEAARLAGWMKQEGRLFVLLPHALAERLNPRRN
ncbi:MAG: MltA domain-containing protein [Alphaproteobacteria bacterium]